MNEGDLDALLAKIPPEGPPGGQCVDDGLLLAHREGRLSSEKIEAVERHLAACAACRALFAELDPVPTSIETWALGTFHRRLRWPALAAVAALAAGLSLALILLPRDDLPSYELSGPFGGVRSTRGEQSAGSLLFVPGSLFQISMRPAVRAEQPVSLLVLIEEPDGTLSPAPESGVSRGDGGGFRYELRAQRLFGEHFGRRKVHAAIVRGTIDLKTLEGSEAQIRKRLPSHRWMTVEIDYQASVEE